MAVSTLSRQGEDKCARQAYQRRLDEIYYFNRNVYLKEQADLKTEKAEQRAEKAEQRAEKAEAENEILRKEIEALQAKLNQ